MKLSWYFAALKDLLKRYARVVRHAWRERQQLDTPQRLPHEAQFLPAALSLQDTPVSPLPRVTAWALMGFALLAILWTVFGRIDMVATAQGKIVPNDRIKVIQSLEPTTIKAIHVSDGQQVKAGQMLIELDGTSTEADKTRVAGDLAIAKLQVARAQAMVYALDKGTAPQLAKLPGIDPIKWQEAERLLAGQYGEYVTKQARIEAEIAKHVAEQRSTQALVAKLQQTVPLARQRASDFKNLVDQNFVSKHGYMEREQARIEQEGDLENQQGRMLEIQAAIRQSQTEKNALSAELRRVTLDSLNEGQQKVATLEQELIKANNRSSLTTMTSPVDGTVQQLAVHTVGGVVTEAQALMVIVPQDNPLEVEALVENKDVGFVNAGQQAEVKIETFQYTKYGTIPAEVTSISSDAIKDEKLGLVYSARIRMKKSRVNVDGKLVNLTPGMAVTVEIKTGRRRVIEYFLSPLLEYSSESLRER